MAPLAAVYFKPVLQVGSSGRALAARWPEGSRVVYRGHPFASGIGPVREELRRRGADVR